MKFYLQRIRIDSQGYDSSGEYWGIGSPLFEYESNEMNSYGYIRASDREDAKERLRLKFPGAKFYR